MTRSDTAVILVFGSGGMADDTAAITPEEIWTFPTSTTGPYAGQI